ncbi:MAG: DHH family phosphoesterase [Limisphaerales bacterium]
MDVQLPRPDVILTHESDLDGFVAGHLLQRLARSLFDTEVRLEAWNTQAWRQRPMKEGSAWICDMAYEGRLDRPDWVVIDHHPVEDRPRNARLIHDTSRSAALLCYDLCRASGLGNANLDRLVALTDIGDLFREDDPDFGPSQEYAALLKTYPFWSLSKLIEGRLESLIEHPLLEVVRTRKRVEDPIGLAWSRERVTEITPSVAWVDVAVGNSNLILHELLRSPDCRHAVLVTLIRKAATGVIVSLRSRNGEALGIAQKLQGGGHPNAAGATLPRSIQSVPDAVEYLQKVLDPKPVGAASLESAFTDLRLGG